MTKMERVVTPNPPSKKSVWKFVGIVTVMFIVVFSIGSMFESRKEEVTAEKALVDAESVHISSFTTDGPLQTLSKSEKVSAIPVELGSRMDNSSHVVQTINADQSNANGLNEKTLEGTLINKTDIAALILISGSSGTGALSLATHRTILAFGDSLTYGLVVKDEGKIQKRTKHPYSDRLQEILKSNNISVAQEGMSGERTREMIKRIPVVLHNLRPAYAVILGGTNDLASLKSEQILANLIELHRVALSTVVGPQSVINTLPVTIPPCKGWAGVNDSSRIEINDGLKIFASHCLHSPVVDLDNIWSGKSETSYWSSDSIHFSEKGYDALGKMIADTFKSWKNTSANPILEKTSKFSPLDVANSILSSVRTKSPFAENMC